MCSLGKIKRARVYAEDWDYVSQNFSSRSNAEKFHRLLENVNKLLELVELYKDVAEMYKEEAKWLDMIVIKQAQEIEELREQLKECCGCDNEKKRGGFRFWKSR